jgi:hypothetical protein
MALWKVMPNPNPILDYRPPVRDPQAALDRADRVMVKVALGVVLVVTILIILSFA